MMKLFLPLLILIVFLFSCRKEATTWESLWTAPMFHDTLKLNNIVNDSTLTTKDGNYYIDFSRNLASISPSKIVEIPDTSIEQKHAIAFPYINMPPGASFVNDNEDHIFDLGATQLKKIRVKSGTISLEVFSPVATKTFFAIELPKVTRDNKPLIKEFEVPAGSKTNLSSNSISIDLAGYNLDLTGSKGNSYNALASKLLVSTDPNGPLVGLTNKDSTIFKIKIENVQIDYAQGYFGNLHFDENYTFESNYLKNKVSGGLDLPELKLNFEVKNGIKASAKTKISKLTNTNLETGQSVNLSGSILNNPYTIQTATGSWDYLVPSKKTIELSASNSNMEQILENMGSKTDVSYSIELNPWGNSSGGFDEFFPNSSLDVRLNAQMPLNIGMNKLYITDTFNIAIQQDSAFKQLLEGELIFKIENAFPFDAQPEVILLDDNMNSLSHFSQLSHIESSLFGQINKKGIKTQFSELKIQLTPDLLTQIYRIKKIVVRLKLNTTSPNLALGDTEKVAIPENSFMKINAIASIKYENELAK